MLKLSTVISSGADIKAAVKQVLTYCQNRSVTIGVVANGHQIVAFLASRQDNVPPLEGKALVFMSLTDIKARFRDFWNQLSSDGTEARNLFKLLQAETVQPPPDKLALRIAGYPGFKNKNAFQTNLKTLAELFIEDIANIPAAEEEFLRSCYSSSGALSQYALTTKNILQSKYSLQQQRELKVDSLQGVSDYNEHLAEEFRADLLVKGLRRRPIVLLGDVGVGKTIFLRHLIKVEAREQLQRAAVFYIDFLKEPSLSSNLKAFIIQRCQEILMNEFEIDIFADNFVRGVYRSDLDRLTKSHYGPLKEANPHAYQEREIQLLDAKIADAANHLKTCIEHLAKAENRLVVVCLDNIDQRPTDFQEQVFQIGHSLAETWPANVFISLRPDTFYHSQKEGALAAYQPRVFAVSPPRLDEVIVKRLQYAIDQLTDTGRTTQTPQWLSVNSASLLEYLDTLLDSFQRSRDLMESIDNLSGGNVREALRFVIAFIGSGHVDAERIIQKHQTMKLKKTANEITKPARRVLGTPRVPDSYVIPVHEFMKAVIYGDQAHYDPASSPVCNVFDISSADGREHFLLLNLLAFVERSGGVAEGFVQAGAIFDFAQRLGFQPSQVHYALDRSVDKRLLEATPKFSENPKKTAYRITTIGLFTMSRLVRWFVYLDAVIVDTPILVERFRLQITNIEHIHLRVKRSKDFLLYLDQEWKKISGSPVAFDWAVVSRDLATNIAYTETAIQAAYVKRTAENRNRPQFGRGH